MWVVVTGVTGNVGTRVVRALSADAAVASIVGLARRRPSLTLDKVEWVAADVSRDDVDGHLSGADVVVHLAWLIQPSHRLDVVEATNVAGSRRVFEATARAGAGALVYASSVGAYSPGPKDRRVDESWPTGGVASSFYSRHKVATERLLDAFEADHPGVRVVRMRPGLIFKRESASGIRRLFLGRLIPPQLLRPSLLPVVLRTDRLVVQAVHGADGAEAYRLDRRGRGPGRVQHRRRPCARRRPAGSGPGRPAGARAGGAVAGGGRPVVAGPPAAHAGGLARPRPRRAGATGRACRDLGWEPTRTAGEALAELLTGIADRASYPTPALAPSGWRSPATSPITPPAPALF